MATTINSGYANSPKLTANIADHADVYGGRALVFDGVVDKLNIDTIEIENDFTISGWFKRQSLVTNYIFGHDANNFIRFHGHDRFFIRLYGQDYFGDTTPIPFTIGNWFHLALTRDSNNLMKLYFNGEKHSEEETSADNVFKTSYIGWGHNTETHNTYYGSMADIKFFDAQLTEAQVQELYKKPENTPSAVQDNLVAWYPMIEGNPKSPQSIVYDHSEKKLGSELVTNGSFDSDTTGWSNTLLSSAPTISHSDGKAVVTYSGSDVNVGIHTTNNPLSGITGLVKVTGYAKVTSGSISSGTLRIQEMFGTDASLDWDGENFTAYMLADGATDDIALFVYANNITIEFDNISVKEVLMGNHATTNFFGDDLVTNGTFDTDANWTKGTGWTIDVSDSNIAECDGTQTGNTNLQQNDLFTVGKTYQITFDLTRTAGNFRLLVGSSGSSGYYTTNATHTYTRVATGNGHLYLQGDEDFVGTVDNVVAKEVGVSSSGFETAVNEPVVPQVPLMRYNQKVFFNGDNGSGTEVLWNDIGGAFASSKFTLSVVHLGRDADGITTIFDITQSAYTDYIRLFRNESGRYYVYIENANSTQNIYEYASYSDDAKFHHIVLTCDGSKWCFYINGYKEREESHTHTTAHLTSATTDMRVGMIGTGDESYRANGIIDELSLWNIALTYDEVKELYADSVVKDATTHSKANDHLLGYWRNDGVSTWTDRSDIQAIGFDGADDYIDCGTGIGNALGDNYAGDLSFSAWVKCDNKGSNDAIFYIGNFNGGSPNINLYVYDNKLIFEINSWYIIKNPIGIDTSLWHHVAFVYKAGNESDTKMYLNGESVGSSSGTFPSTTDMDLDGLKTIVGTRYKPTYDGNWEGFLGQVALWNKELSSSEISAIYALGRKNVDLTTSYSTNLQGYWFLNPSHSNPDLTGTDKILDRSGNGNHGTQSGGVSFFGANDGSVQGTPDSITIREGLNSNRDGLGFYFTNPDSNVLRLNGESEYLHIENDLLAGKPTGTISFWAKTSNTGNQAILGYHRNQWSIRFNKTTMFLGIGDVSVTASSSLDNSGWGYHAITFDQGTAKFYKLNLDTPLYHTSTDYLSNNVKTFPSNTNGMFIGKRNHASPYFYGGLVDEIKIYDRVLTLDELTKNYKHQKGKHKND